ncbi:sensor histidine kinase [Actinocatenispora comari]|uniref:sensor histidine kinase n=1 Tax=Actinocatenispora comari TaxID=2807577 RepID=UPI001A912080|nr:histidine kinase [Actinocatenispora comari]
MLLAAFCVAATASAPAHAPLRVLDVGGVLLLAVPALVSPWVDRYAALVLVVTGIAPTVFYALGYASIFAPAPATAAVFGAMLAGRSALASVTVAGVCLGSFAAGLGHGLSIAAATVGPAWIVGWMVAAASAGVSLRTKRRLLEQERLRAEVAAQHGAEQERLRIARELHDSLTHNISVINVQAAMATHLMGREPDRVPDALENIRDASSSALQELRSTVEVLRRVDAGAHDAADEPGPGLDRLPELLTAARSTGLVVTCDAAFDHTGIPPHVDRAAYRIVQEALSNAGRHSPGSEVVVTVARNRGLCITVVNGRARRPAEAAAGSGVGLVGMRERVASVGGRLETGPYEAGFRVQAELPVPTDSEQKAHR